MNFGKKHFPFYYLAVSTVAFVAFVGLINAGAGPGRGTPQTGLQIYRQQCASCHGAKGEGTKAYHKPLTGSQSVGQLAKFITQSMPPGPKKCPATDAKKVAAYIFDAFYSSLAQERNRPARIELSRLTVRQYRNAVTDLIASFRPPVGVETRRGLRGEYYKAGHFRGNDRVLERVDPQIQFDYGTGTPTKEQTDPYFFAMRWEGSVLAPDTGAYELVVRTEHAMRLWVNDPERPLIDATVKSGNDTEYRATVFLLGGRAYPLRLEFSKAHQGVDDQNKQKRKPPEKASLTLLWRQPKRPLEPIPARCLTPAFVPRVFASETPFPPDDRSIGYERGTSVSKAWDEATTEAGLETADYVLAHLGELAGTADNAPDREAKVQTFCRKFVERAFRRPLTAEDTAFYVDRQFRGTTDLDTKVKKVVLLALKSPRFLYREIGSDSSDPYAVASRLSFGLWDSLPDAELLRAAGAGELTTREQVAKQAERMTADPRTWTKLRSFLLQWLKVETPPDLAKNAKRFPGFDEAVASDLRTSLELFLEQTAWSDKADFRELLTTDKLVLNGRLAKLYGVGLPPGAPFQTVTLDTNERSGVLTHPYLLASFAYFDHSSPIHRGVLIARNILGRTLQPPPQAFTPLAAALHPKLTTRQRVTLQTKPAACVSCHGMINPLGFTLEKFDAIGRLRTEENGSTVDASGTYLARNGKTVQFSGAPELSRFLADSDETHAAFVEKLFQHFVKQPVRAFGPKTLPDLERSFAANQYNIRKEIIAIMTTSAPGRERPGTRTETVSRP